MAPPARWGWRNNRPSGPLSLAKPLKMWKMPVKWWRSMANIREYIGELHVNMAGIWNFKMEFKEMMMKSGEISPASSCGCKGNYDHLTESGVPHFQTNHAFDGQTKWRYRGRSSTKLGIISTICTVPSGKSQFLMGKSTISMGIFNSYVSLPEGNQR